MAGFLVARGLHWRRTAAEHRVSDGRA